MSAHNINIINQLPDYIFWKDQSLRYLGGNSAFLQGAGLLFTSELLGCTDYDLPWSVFAKKYRYDDLQVLKTKRPVAIREEHIDITGKVTIATVIKKALYSDDGTLIGVIGSYKKESVRNTAINYKFSIQQRKILNKLMMGHTAKEIAEELQLSKRTVEAYIEAIKSKLGARNKIELIKKVILEKLIPY